MEPCQWKYFPTSEGGFAVCPGQATHGSPEPSPASLVIVI